MNLRGFPWGLHTIYSLIFAVVMSLAFTIPVVTMGRGTFSAAFLFALTKYGSVLFVIMFIANFYPCWKKNVKDKQPQQQNQQQYIQQPPENYSSSAPTDPPRSR